MRISRILVGIGDQTTWQTPHLQRHYLSITFISSTNKYRTTPECNTAYAEAQSRQLFLLILTFSGYTRQICGSMAKAGAHKVMMESDCPNSSNS